MCIKYCTGAAFAHLQLLLIAKLVSLLVRTKTSSIYLKVEYVQTISTNLVLRLLEHLACVRFNSFDSHVVKPCVGKLYILRCNLVLAHKLISVRSVRY